MWVGIIESTGGLNRTKGGRRQNSLLLASCLPAWAGTPHLISSDPLDLDWITPPASLGPQLAGCGTPPSPASHEPTPHNKTFLTPTDSVSLENPDWYKITKCLEHNKDCINAIAFLIIITTITKQSYRKTPWIISIYNFDYKLGDILMEPTYFLNHGAT